MLCPVPPLPQRSIVSKFKGSCKALWVMFHSNVWNLVSLTHGRPLLTVKCRIVRPWTENIAWVKKHSFCFSVLQNLVPFYLVLCDFDVMGFFFVLFCCHAGHFVVSVNCSSSLASTATFHKTLGPNFPAPRFL